jgi:hypothetical protein
MRILNVNKKLKPIKYNMKAKRRPKKNHDPFEGSDFESAE